ncbi:MAG: hypothetical protein I3273_05280 [Candidatus Moeniiplasma glomeromycotorum]|nr:hypothetical protein [Candidatus Moeniiplasma glomeromycotorum]MCE8168004.1 hypothetical protein [Candidatus Moeniiplasma glomeromycotorum]MCE8169503.1 hypothetical protein [Candidatus Moeniiplasma glomeromycotorum]
MIKIKDDKVKLQATISEQEKKIKELENFIIEEKNNRDELDKCHKELETRLEAEIKKLKTEKEKLSFSLSVAESELLKSEKLELIASSPTEKSETREIITTTLIQGLQRKINRLELELEDKERKLRDLKEKYNDEIVEKAKQGIKETEEFETFSELYDQQEELKNKIVELERELAKSKVKGKENCDIEKHKYLENQIIILLTTIKTTEKSLEKVKMTLDLTGKEREKLLEIIEAQKEQVKSGQLTSTEQEFLKLIPDPLYSAREGEPIEKCFGWENFETQLERLQTWMNEKQTSDFPNLDAFSILISLTRVKELRERIEELKNKSELEKPTELEAEKRCEAKEYEEHKNLVEKLILKEAQIISLREESDHYYAKIVGEEDLENEIRKLKGELLAVQGKGKKQEIGSSCRDCKEYWEKWNEVREKLEKSEIIQKEQVSKIENLNELLNHNGVEFAKKLTGQEIKNRKENKKIVQQIKRQDEYLTKLQTKWENTRKEIDKIKKSRDNYSDSLSQEKREREIEQENWVKKESEMTNQIHGLMDEKTKLVTKNNELEKDLKQLQDTGAKLTDEISEKNKTITNLKTSLTDEKNKRTTAENDLTDYQAAATERINDLRNELNETTRAYENSINQNSDLRFNLNEARDLNTNLQQQLSQMEQAADSYWEHVKGENKNYRTEIKRLQGLVDTLPGEFLDTQDEWLKRDYPDEFAELERNGKALNVKNLIELLQKKLADYEKLKSNWDQEKKEVEDIYQIEKENWETEFKTLKDNLSTEQAKRKKYTRYYTNTNLKLVQKQLQAEKQQALITNLKQDLNRLAREYQQAKSHSDSTNYDQVRELKNQIKEKNETIEHLESKMTALNQLAETELTEHEQNNTNLQNQLNDQKSTLDEQTKTIALQDGIEAKLRQTNDDLNTDYQALKTEQVAAQQKINDLTAENRDLDTYLAGLDDVLLNKNSELTKFLREKGQLEKQIEKLKARLTNTKNDWEAEVDGLEKQNKKLQKKLAAAIELFGQEKVKNKKLKNFKGDANKLFERAKLLNYLLETRTEQRDRARQKLKDLKAQQEELKRTAETKQVSLALIKYQGESISDEQIDQQFLTSVITDTSNALVDEIAKTQNYLGVKDLTQIATAPEYKLPKDKTLTDLIQSYYDNDIQQVIQAFPELSHLGSDSSVGEVINTLKTLLNKPPIIITKTEKDNSFQVELEQAQKVINRLERELSAKPVKEIVNTPFGEELTVIIQLELTSLQELFGNQLDPLTQKQIREATTYSQVVQARQNFLAKHLNFTAGSTLNSAPIQSTWPVERVFWLIWLLISLGVIGSLLVKMKNKRKKN